MIISKADFADLTLKSKIRYIYMGGTFLMDIRYYGYKINLYMLNNFYVEVFYNHKDDRIEKVEIMQNRHSRMKFYADKVKLIGL